jgi:hypothetical protein
MLSWEMPLFRWTSEPFSISSPKLRESLFLTITVGGLLIDIHNNCWGGIRRSPEEAEPAPGHQAACAAFGGLCRGKATSGVVRGNKKLVLLIDGVMAAHIIINSY